MAKPDAGDVHVLVLAPNCRIDNAAGLSESCGLGQPNDLQALLVAGWRKWGTTLAQQMRGAFAFVLYDCTTHSVYAARDHFGLSPLFVADRQDRLYFGTSSQAVRAILTETVEDNELLLADFVSGILTDRTQTFFRGIDRFPQAHWALYSAGRAQSRQYWALSDVPAREAPQEPAEQFRVLLDRAVGNCVRPGETALMLSGGLDSSAIAVSAADLPGERLTTFSLTYRNTPGWCDAPHLSAVARATGLQPIEVPADRHQPLNDMEFWLAAVDGPYLSYGHSVSFQLPRMAKDAGASIVLTGHGGDEVVSYGFGRLNELALAGKWFQLWMETKGVAGLLGDSRTEIFGRYLAHFKSLRPILSRLRNSNRQIEQTTIAFLDPEFSRQIAPDRYLRTSVYHKANHTERMAHEEALSVPLQLIANEIIALCGAAVGIEARSPFFSVDLVEFSLSLPSEWKLRNGLSRYILRRAYAGALPEETLKRRDKFDFTRPFIAGLVDQRDKVLDLTGSDLAHRWGLVNRDGLTRARDNLYRNGTGIDRLEAFFLWRVAMLAMWAEVARQPLAAPVMKEVM
ncbi:MAG: asparagine synthase-related protein [Erythrobacter sp.]